MSLLFSKSQQVVARLLLVLLLLESCHNNNIPLFPQPKKEKALKTSTHHLSFQTKQTDINIKEEGITTNHPSISNKLALPANDRIVPLEIEVSQGKDSTATSIIQGGNSIVERASVKQVNNFLSRMGNKKKAIKTAMTPKQPLAAKQLTTFKNQVIGQQQLTSSQRTSLEKGEASQARGNDYKIASLLVNQVCTTKEGYQVKFKRKAAGELSARVEQHFPTGFTREMLSVVIEPGCNYSESAVNNPSWQKQYIHLTKEGVFVGQMGLLGGMQGENEEAEGEEEKEGSNERSLHLAGEGAYQVINHPATATEQIEETTPRLLLSLDGGGIRGLLEAYTLNHLEETIESTIKAHFKDPAAPAPDVRLGECFDLIAGTSTGGIIALAMRMLDPKTNRPKLKMRDILALYEKKGHIIFPSVSKFAGWLASKFDPQPLENLFKEYFGEETLKDLQRPTVITGYDADQEGLYLFRSYEANNKQRHNYYLRDVARATSAAPTYFPAAGITSEDGERHFFVDGGIAANNPTLNGYQEARKLFSNAVWNVISLGTGSANLFTLSSKQSGGKLQWASDISNVLMNSSSKLIDDLTARDTELQGDDYIRLQFELDQKVAELDNATPENINRLKGYVKRKIEERDPVLMKIKDKLLAYYAGKNYYVFHPLIQKAYEQLQTGNGAVSLSNRYLTARAIWELMHALSANNMPTVTCLDLSHNQLSTNQLSYLGKLQSLTSLNLSNTNLTIQGLTLLKNTNLALQVLTARQNPALENAENQELSFLMNRYETIYVDPILHHRLGGYYKSEGNYDKAVKLYRDSQDADNQFELAQLYLMQDPSTPEFDQGFQVMEELTEKGYKEAQRSLGRFYHRANTAIQQYLIKNKKIPAANSEKELKKACLKQAEYWYKLAARQGEKYAALALAKMYEEEEIIAAIPADQPRDNRYQLQEALRYYRIAQEAGSTEVIKNIQKLEKELKGILTIS